MADIVIRTSNVPRDSPFASWDGYLSDSFFSGLVIRFVDNGERCIVGWYCA